MKSTSITTGAAALVVTALVGALGLSQAPPASAAPSVAHAADQPPPSLDELVDSSAPQQRWLSVPLSRLVLNPYDFDRDGTELDQNGGPSLPLSTGFYAHDSAVRTTGLLQTFVAPGGAPTGPDDTAPAWTADFSSGWKASGVQTAPDGAGGIELTTRDSGDHWGDISQSVTVDLTASPLLTVDVPKTTGKWAVKVAQPGKDDVKLHGEDLDRTGKVTFDVAALTGWTGTQTFTLRLFAVGTPGTSATTDFASAQIHAASFPDDGTTAGFVDEFTTADVAEWRDSSSGVTLTSDGSVGTLRLPGSEYGFRARQVTVDVDANPVLSVRVAAGSGKWAVKVNRSLAGDDVTLQADTDASGVLSYDLRGLTGWKGNTTFFIKLFQVGKGQSGTSTGFDRLSIHPGAPWLETASKVAATWSPAGLTSTATYAGRTGSVTAADAFDATDVDAFTRTVTSDLDGGVPVIAGPYNERATYDSTTRTLTAPGGDATFSVAFPAEGDVRFYTSQSALRFGQAGSAAPSSAAGFWAVTLPSAGGSVAVATAPRADDGSEAAATAASARAALPEAVRAASAAHWTSFWADYLDRVPMAQDFEVRRVADGGVSAADVRRFYLKAWVGLEMNVLPATPETGNLHAQLGTGKPSMWMNGTPGTRNVASWDSLLGMQQLVYTDPENAWQSFEGMMALVNDEVSPDDPAYGELGGESLPSRKAQTAWILFQATGDASRLAGVYDALKLHLAWERENMRWVLHGHNYLDERDSEFVASLVFDLEYASKIARALGHEADAADWDSWVPELTRDYQEWFFPTTADANGTVWPTVQKVYLDAGRSSAPPADPGEAAPYRNEDGAWVNPGWSFYTTTALVMEGLDAEHRSKVRARFEADYDEHAQLAGLGSFAIKAPDAQLIVYGLLDSAAASEHDEAAVIVNALTRDMTKSGQFAEVYYAKGAVGDAVGSRGVRPSLFGISNLIDNVFIANGVRTAGGEPEFVRLSGAVGGVTGLTWQGKRLDVDIDGDRIALSGAALEGTAWCRAFDAPTGVTVPLHECAEQPQATITLSVQEARAGEALTVTGSGFPADADVTVTLHSDPVELGTVRADASGAFVLATSVPRGAEVGAHRVVATAGLLVAEAPFRVLPAGSHPDKTDGPVGKDDGHGVLGVTGAPAPWLALLVVGVAVGAGLLLMRRRSA